MTLRSRGPVPNALAALALAACGGGSTAPAAPPAAEERVVQVRALALEPRSIRAHHARAHVLEMQGRAAEGIRWMGERAAYWTGQGAASTHVWWHLALHHLELGNARHALAIYDRRIAAGAAPALNELIDASALLVYRAAWACDTSAARVSREVAMAKLYATEAAQRAIDTSVQLHGGDGVRKGSVVERLYREIRALRIYEGASDVQRVIIARAVLADTGPGRG